MTQSWTDQLDSLLDHILMNAPGRLLYYRNIKRLFSDHNLIVLSFRMKDRIDYRHEIIKRDRKDFDMKGYIENIVQIDWEDFFLNIGH